MKKYLENYFSLDIPLLEVIEKWTLLDTGDEILREEFKKNLKLIGKIRILRQPPRDALVHLVTKNNKKQTIWNTKEILYQNYGNLLGEIHGRKYFAPPSFSCLRTLTEAILLKYNFGFRAKTIPTVIESLFKMLEEIGKKINEYTKEEAEIGINNEMDEEDELLDSATPKFSPKSKPKPKSKSKSKAKSPAKEKSNGNKTNSPKPKPILSLSTRSHLLDPKSWKSISDKKLKSKKRKKN